MTSALLLTAWIAADGGDPPQTEPETQAPLSSAAIGSFGVGLKVTAIPPGSAYFTGIPPLAIDVTLEWRPLRTIWFQAAFIKGWETHAVAIGVSPSVSVSPRSSVCGGLRLGLHWFDNPRSWLGGVYTGDADKFGRRPFAQAELGVSWSLSASEIRLLVGAVAVSKPEFDAPSEDPEALEFVGYEMAFGPTFGLGIFF